VNVLKVGSQQLVPRRREWRTFGWYTNLDDNGSDGFVRAEEGVGTAGILLGELAHDLHRLVVGGCLRSCGCQHQIPFSSSRFQSGEGKNVRPRNLGDRPKRTLSSDNPSAAGSSCGRRRGRAEGEPPAPDGGGDGGCHRRPVPTRRSGGGARGRGWAEGNGAERGELRE
jgi:hypothetical protein